MESDVKYSLRSLMGIPRWLWCLAVVTIAAALVPLIGIVFPALEVLRGFMLTWVFVWFAWILVGFYHTLKFLTGGK